MTDSSLTPFENAIKNHEKSVLDALADGIYDFNFKTKKSEVSPNFFHILGYDSDEFKMTEEKWDSLIHPEDLDEANQSFDEYLAKTTTRYTAEYRMRCKDGSYKWVSCTGKVTEFDGDEPVRMIGAISDIHARKQLELAMNEILEATNKLRGKALFKFLSKQLSDVLKVDYVVITLLESDKSLKSIGMWEKDHFRDHFQYDIAGTPCELIYTNNQILFVDDELFEKFPEDTYLKERNIKSYYGVPFWDPANTLIGHVFIMNEKARSIEPWMQRITELSAQTIGSEVERLKNQERLNEMNASLEKTVLKRTKELENAIHELDSFFYKAAHDLRAPISTLEGIYNQIVDGRLNKKESKDFMEMLGIQIDLLQKLNRSIIEVGNVRKHEPMIERILVSDLVDDLIRSSNLPPDLICQMKVPSNLQIETDKYLFDLILDNFIQNSVTFRDRERTDACVIISAEKKGNKTWLTIEDNGVGIPEKLKDNYFKMFFRASPTDSGFGLGLYKAKLAANRIDADLTFESKVGSGSKATIVL